MESLDELDPLVVADFARLAYVRGFLLGVSGMESVPAHFWSRRLPNGYLLYHHPDLPIHQHTTGSTSALLLGCAVDLRDGVQPAPAAALSAALATSEEKFLDLLDWFSGRYVVIAISGGKTRLFHDATGMMSIFYSTNAPVAGSHARLVAEAIGEHPSAVELAVREGAFRAKWGYPGGSTPYGDVLMLSPNTRLQFPDQTVLRYYPRRNLLPCSVEEAAERTGLLMERHVDRLMETGTPVLMTLTAGGDTRASLAAAHRYLDRIRFYTYRRTDEWLDHRDAEIASRISDLLKLDHFIIDFRQLNDDIWKGFKVTWEILQKNTHYAHIPGMNHLYLHLLGYDRYVNIRSSVIAVGCAYYRKSRKIAYPPPAGPEALAEIYKLNSYRNRRLPTAVEEAFKEYWSVNQWNRLQDFNHDPFDLLYWEFRMGAWHSQCIAGSDIAFNTHDLTNARTILDSLMSVPLEARKVKAINRWIIRTRLPVLDEIRINPPWDRARARPRRSRIWKQIFRLVQRFDPQWRSVLLLSASADDFEEGVKGLLSRSENGSRKKRLPLKIVRQEAQAPPDDLEAPFDLVLCFRGPDAHEDFPAFFEKLFAAGRLVILARPYSPSAEAHEERTPPPGFDASVLTKQAGRRPLKVRKVRPADSAERGCLIAAFSGDAGSPLRKAIMSWKAR